MSEESKTGQGTPIEEAAAETRAIADEMNKLGHKVSEAIQRAWGSVERKQAEDEIRKALSMAGERIDDVAADIRASGVPHEIREQATKVMEDLEKSPITQDLRKTLLDGLRRLNTELSEFLAREDLSKVAEKADEAVKASKDAANTAAKATGDVVDATAKVIKK